VGEHEAGQRLFQVAHDPRCAKSVGNTKGHFHFTRYICILQPNKLFDPQYPDLGRLLVVEWWSP